MSTKYIHVKKPPRNFLQKRKDFSRQGFLLSKQANINNLTHESTTEMSKLDVSNFESIFDYLYPNLTKKVIKSERKCFKSVSQSEINQLKIKMEQETQRRQQKRLNFLLNGHIRSYTQRNTQNTFNSSQRNPSKLLSHNLNSSIQQNQTQKKLQNTSKYEKQRKLLESTNFSIKAISSLTQLQEKKQGSIKLNSRSIMTKKSQLRTCFKSYFSTNKKDDQQKSLQNKNQQIQQHNEYEMDIKLSIKSMSKSEQGEGQVNHQEKQMHLNESQTARILGKSQVNKCPQKKNKRFFTPKNKKCNHLLIRFDKKLLLSASQINDPCMRIERIKSISSRIQTEPNF